MALSLARIRAHIRQDETYDDALLEAYRQAALQACAEYTGLPLVYAKHVKRLRVYNNEIRLPDVSAYNVMCVGVDGAPMAFIRSPDGRVLSLPSTMWRPDGFQVDVWYETGPRGPQDPELPPIIEIGCLKFIAHLYEERGASVNDSGQTGRNSSVIASGAAEMWNLAKTVGF